MSGPKGREAGRRSRQRLRVGWDFDSFRGVDTEDDAGSVTPSQFVALVNAQTGYRVIPRDGLTKETTVAALDSKVMGAWDLESYMEAASGGGGGGGDGSDVGGRIYVAMGGECYIFDPTLATGAQWNRVTFSALTKSDEAVLVIATRVLCNDVDGKVYWGVWGNPAAGDAMRLYKYTPTVSLPDVTEPTIELTGSVHSAAGGTYAEPFEPILVDAAGKMFMSDCGYEHIHPVNVPSTMVRVRTGASWANEDEDGGTELPQADPEQTAICMAGAVLNSEVILCYYDGAFHGDSIIRKRDASGNWSTLAFPAGPGSTPYTSYAFTLGGKVYISCTDPSGPAPWWLMTYDGSGLSVLRNAAVGWSWPTVMNNVLWYVKSSKLGLFNGTWNDDVADLTAYGTPAIIANGDYVYLFYKPTSGTVKVVRSWDMNTWTAMDTQTLESNSSVVYGLSRFA